MSGKDGNNRYKRSPSPASLAHALGYVRWEFDIQPQVHGLVTWDWDIPSGTVHYSPEWRNIMLDPDNEKLETNVDSWWPRMHEDDIEVFLEVARNIEAGLFDDYQTFFRIRRLDETWAWLLSKGSVTEKDANNMPLRVSGALMDISHLRSDPKFQHGSAGVGLARYHAMLENSPDLIVRMDRELFPLYVNPRVSRYLDRENHQLPGNEYLNTLGISPEQLAFLQRNVDKVFSEGVSTREMITFSTAKRQDFTGEYSFWPEYDDNGKVMAAMTQFRDLTEQVQTEKRAKLNEMRLSALYELTQMHNAPITAVLDFAVDSLTRLTGSGYGFLFFPHNYPSPKGRVVWSKNHHDFLPGKYLTEDLLPPDLVNMVSSEGSPTLKRIMRNGQGDKPVRTHFDDTMYVMRFISAPIFDGDRVVCIAAVCNKQSDYIEADLQQLEAFIGGAWLILQRHEFTRELQRARDEAILANRVKDEFLANVSHELRTPLNGILSMLQLLDMFPLTGQQQEYVRTASTSGQALLRILSDILDFSRIASGRMELDNDIFDLKGTVKSSLNLFHGQAAEKGLDFHVVLDDKIPPALIGDDARVRQIIFNIVGNALKFTDKGSITVECSLLRDTPSSGPVRVYLAVKDTGIGIAQEEQSKIFQAFTQLDSSSTRKRHGTGLGLSIVQRLVSLMNGGITVESEPGKGTAIHCSLRFDLPRETPLPKYEYSEVPEVQEAMPLDILVAEDDEVGRFAIRSFLEKAGHRPVCVENGKQALEALMLYPFHCLFTDIQMPEIDGLELVSRIRARRLDDITPSEKTREKLRAVIPGDYEAILVIPDDITVISVSAHAMSGDKERFIKSGMDFYISKPLIMNDLISLLGQISHRLSQRDSFLQGS